MTLRDIIIAEIKKNGPISFCRFMEMALYYPGLGYYTSAVDRIGRDGDYYTSPVLSPVFAAMIARQLEEMWRLMGSGSFTVAEYGAGSGRLATEVMRCIKGNPHFYENVSFHAIEKSPAFPDEANKNGEIQWHTSLNEMLNCVT